MHPEQPPILRERIAQNLAARTTPATATELATELLRPDHPSAYRQVQRALTQLENTGRAVREPDRTGRPGRPDQWRTST